MNFEVTPLLDHHEAELLREAISPYRQLPEGRHWEAAQASMWTEQRRLTRKMLEGILEILTELRGELEKQTRGYAHPAWVADTEQMLLEGKAPLVMNPVAAVRVITEVRTRQVAKCDVALEFLVKLLEGLDRCEATCKEITDELNVQNEMLSLPEGGELVGDPVRG